MVVPNSVISFALNCYTGTPKAGVDIVQQAQASNVKDDLNFQRFGLSPYGHIYLANKPSLILGIKESFFARREGLHVHLQLVDKRHLDRKEQRWDFVLPIVKEASAETLKRSASSSTVKSTAASVKVPAVAQIKEDGKDIFEYACVISISKFIYKKMLAQSILMLNLLAPVLTMLKPILFLLDLSLILLSS